MKFMRSHWAAILIVVTLSVLTGGVAIPRQDESCTDRVGCSEPVSYNDGLQVKAADGSVYQVTEIVMRLSSAQAELFRDPNKELKRVKSTLLLAFAGKPAEKCSVVEERANTALTLYVEQAWQPVKGDKTPITLCEHLVPDLASVAEIS